MPTSDDLQRWTLELSDRVTPGGGKVLAAFGKARDWSKSGAASIAEKGLTSLGSSFVATAAKYLGVAALATAGFGLAAAGVSLVADAQGLKDRSGVAMSALLKSRDGATAAYSRILDFAHFFGEDGADALARFQANLAAGFSPRDAEKLQQAFGDLKIVTPWVNLDSLGSAFGVLRSKGVVELADFQGAVTAAGLNLTLAYEAIGKRIGRPAREVEALIGSGRVDAGTGIVGLLDAINQRTNSRAAGEQLAKFASTTTGLMLRLKGLPSQYVQRMTADDSPIRDSLGKLLTYLDPKGPNAGRIIGGLNVAFVEIGKALADWTTPGGLDRIGKGISLFVDAVPRIVVATNAIAKGVLWFSDVPTRIGAFIGAVWGRVREGSLVATGMLASIVAVASPIGAIGVAAVGIAKWTIGAVKSLGSWFSDLGKWGLSVGGHIVAGLWQGIRDAWAGILRGLTVVWKALPKPVRDALGIASPSKVFKGFGEAAENTVRDRLVAGIEGARTDVATWATSSTTSTTTSSTSTSESTVRERHIYVNGSDDMDRHELASAVERGVMLSLVRPGRAA